MGIGGGDSFSTSAALTIIAIIGGLFLLFFPPLIKWLDKNNFLNKKIIIFSKKYVPLIPPVSFLLAMLLNIYDHLILNFSNKHVSMYLNESSSIFYRLLAVFVGPSGKIGLLLVVYAISISLLIYNRPKFLSYLFPKFGTSESLNDKLIQLSGFFWFLILAGLLPSSSFAKDSLESVGLGLSDNQIYSEFMNGFLGLILAGICLSITILSLSLHSMSRENRKSHHHLFVLIPVFIIGLFLIKISGLFTGADWYSNGNYQLYSLDLEQAIIDPYFGSRLAVFVTLFYMCIFLPIIQYWNKNVNYTKFEGEFRWLALGLSYLHSIALIIVGTFFVMKSLDSISSFQGSLWLSLKTSTPIIAFGLAGSLLPVIGFDEDVRPELWGWRVGIAFGVLINSLWNPLIVYTIPSVIIAILCTFFIPFVIETKNNMPFTYKLLSGLFVALLTIYTMIQTSIFNISTSIIFVLGISFVSAIIFEVVNEFNNSHKITGISEQE